ncbi:MAG TPA: hypothetical protein VJ754_00380, partial [Anaerolineae bacterium]|nr:hypothetical protein [Anaerolineae bacterium]
MRAQVDDLLAGLHTILGENLVGVYLHGSLALGCFNPAQSGVDLLVVRRQTRPVGMADFRNLFR